MSTASNPTPSATSRPAARYGEKPQPQTNGVAGKVVAIIGIILVALIVVMLGRYVIQRQEQPISATLVSHERVDDTTSRVWFDVERKEDTMAEPSYCIITSLNYDMAEIGRREIVIPAGGDRIQRMHVDIPVNDLPVNGGVYGCASTMPPYLDPTAEHPEAR